jgi:hypothetical protein
MTETLHPQVASLAAGYARDLARSLPSRGLDARIERMVAAPRQKVVRAPIRPARRRPLKPMTWAAAAGFAALAVATGVIIGVRVERAVAPPPVTQSGEPSWPPADFTMWPTDSVALKIPAEFSSHGTLVAVDGKSRKAGTRYWVDIIVSNDGTVRIENIVPAAEEKHGINTQTP